MDKSALLGHFMTKMLDKRFILLYMQELHTCILLTCKMRLSFILFYIFTFSQLDHVMSQCPEDWFDATFMNMGLSII